MDSTGQWIDPELSSPLFSAGLLQGAAAETGHQIARHPCLHPGCKFREPNETALQAHLGREGPHTPLAPTSYTGNIGYGFIDPCQNLNAANAKLAFGSVDLVTDNRDLNIVNEGPSGSATNNTSFNSVGFLPSSEYLFNDSAFDIRQYSAEAPGPLTTAGPSSLFASEQSASPNIGASTGNFTPSAASNTQRVQTSNSRVPCTYPSCPSTFSRVSDMQRHAKKHQPNARMHNCWVAGCNYNGAKGFYRHDKLLAHQRACHGM